MTAIERLRQRLSEMKGRIHGITLSDNPGTPEEIAEELLKMIDAVEAGNFTLLEFGDSRQEQPQ